MRYFISYTFYAHGHTRIRSTFVEVDEPITDDRTLEAAVERIECHKPVSAVVAFQKA